MIGLKRKLQSVRISIAAIKAQAFKISFKDKKQLDQVFVTNATRHSTHLAVKSYVDHALSNVTSVPANTAAISVKVMHIPSVICAKN